MGHERHVKLFRNGHNQAVRIPREFELPATRRSCKDGDRLIIEAWPKRGLRDIIAWLREQPPLGPDDDFPEIEDPAPEPVDL